MKTAIAPALLFFGLALVASPAESVHIKRATLQSKGGATVASAEADSSGRVTFRGVKPGEYKVVLTNAAGRSVTVGDLDGDGALDIWIVDSTGPTTDVKSPRDVATGQASGKRQAIVGGALPGGAVISAREAGSGMATGKRQHKPINFVMEWSGTVKGGFASELDATRAGQRMPPSPAGCCAVKITADATPGTIEIQSYSWGLSQSGSSPK
jgi:hypothetical protein